MTEGLPPVARVEPGEVTPALVTALYTGAVVSRVEAGVVVLTGPGAVTSFQGLLTNDVELPGDGSFVYGALLTPKGMIVVDGWAARLGATVSYTVPADGGGPERALAIFTRSVPPRLARVSDRTADVAVYRLAGPGALAVAVAAGPEGPPTPGPLPARPPGVVTYVDRDVGRVTSLAFVPETGVAGAGRWIGLALIRREVGPGSVVRAAGRDARVVDLPFAFPIAAPA